MVYDVQTQYDSIGEPYEVKASVIAINKMSAQVQLDWIVKNKECMCAKCLISYERDYSVYVKLPEGMPEYSMCIRR